MIQNNSPRLIDLYLLLALGKSPQETTTKFRESEMTNKFPYLTEPDNFIVLGLLDGTSIAEADKERGLNFTYRRSVCS